MGLGRFSLAVLAGALAFKASAADDFIKGVYVQSEELCANATKSGLDSVLQEGNVILTARGLEGVDYDCEFLQVMKATRAPGWVVTALCQEPGHAFPDTLSILPLSAGQLEMTSVRVPQPDSVPGNDATYYFCEGISPP
jgi:hypothetical protein